MNYTIVMLFVIDFMVYMSTCTIFVLMTSTKDGKDIV